MRRGLNRVMIIGQLERDPEMRFTPNGRPVTSFTLSTTHDWISAEGVPHRETEWFNVVAWGDLARLCHDQLDKGKTAFVEGRLKTRSWEDHTGKRHFRTEIVARDVIIFADEEHESLYDQDYDEGYNNF